MCTEPHLQPLTGEHLDAAAAKRLDAARLDIKARHFWSTCTMTFFNVRGFHASCKTYIGTPVNRISANQGTEKRRSFNERILQVERGTLTPLVFGLPGGCGYQAHKFIKRLASLESAKTGEECSSGIRDLRTVISFSLLLSATTALRGFRKVRGVL